MAVDSWCSLRCRAEYTTIFQLARAEIIQESRDDCDERLKSQEHALEQKFEQDQKQQKKACIGAFCLP